MVKSSHMLFYSHPQLCLYRVSHNTLPGNSVQVPDFPVSLAHPSFVRPASSVETRELVFSASLARGSHRTQDSSSRQSKVKLIEKWAMGTSRRYAEPPFWGVYSIGVQHSEVLESSQHPWGELQAQWSSLSTQGCGLTITASWATFQLNTGPLRDLWTI